MQVAPAPLHNQARHLEQRLPLFQSEYILADLGLHGTAVQTKPPGKEASIGHENEESGVGRRNPHHFAQCGGLVQEMLKRSHAGDQVETGVGKGQRFSRSNVELSFWQVSSTLLNGELRNIDAAYTCAVPMQKAEPLPQATSHVQYRLAAKVAEAAGNRSVVPRQLPVLDLRLGVVVLVVEIPNRLELVLICHGLCLQFPGLPGKVMMPVTDAASSRSRFPNKLHSNPEANARLLSPSASFFPTDRFKTEIILSDISE